MTTKPKSKALLALESLKRKHPNASKQELFARYETMVMDDEDLKHSMIEDAFYMVCDDLYNEAAREGREVPPFLKRPS